MKCDGNFSLQDLNQRQPIPLLRLHEIRKVKFAHVHFELQSFVILTLELLLSAAVSTHDVRSRAGSLGQNQTPRY